MSIYICSSIYCYRVQLETMNVALPDHLAWVPKKNKKECLKAGGFLFVKKDGKYKIVK